MPASRTPPTPEQQALLERIAAQRERLRSRRSAPGDRVDPRDPLPDRLWAFARLHPLTTAAAVALLTLAGPARLVRWAGVLLPLIVQARRP